MSSVNLNVTKNEMVSMERSFIRTYKQLPNLWQTDHWEYNNKAKRNVSYDILLKILRTYVPNATRCNVRQKINILRSTYRKELRKYLASKTITAEGEISYTYKPTTWKFHAMKFLDGLMTEEGEQEFKGDEVIIQETIEEDDSLNELEEEELEFLEDLETESVNEEQEMSKIELSPLHIECDNPKRLRVKRKWSKYHSNDDDIISRECKAIGANVACKLQRMNPQQRYQAEILINKVLIRGLKDKLKDETDITDLCFVVEHKIENEC